MAGRLVADAKQFSPPPLLLGAGFILPACAKRYLSIPRLI
jgi:hypothetical protein